MKVPLVSVGMCSWNSSTTIESAISSLQAQDYTNWELIIIDADSSDDTISVINNKFLSDPRIRLLTCNWQQPWTASTLEQLRLAKGSFFMWLDPDDFISPNWISSLLKIHSTNSCIGAVGILQLVDKDNKVVTNNVSSGRFFRFTSENCKNTRIMKSLLLPESFGLVNLLYGLWSIESLRSINLWNANDKTLTFDQVFALEALSNGRVIYTKDTYHCRRTHWSLLKTRDLIADPINFNNLLVKENRIKPFVYLFEFLTISPELKLYRDWLKNQDLKFKFLFFLIIIVRRIVSESAPIAYWLRRTFNGIYGK